MGGIHPCRQMEKKKTELQEKLKACFNQLGEWRFFLPRYTFKICSQICFCNLILDILLRCVPSYTFEISQICFCNLFLAILLRCVPSYTLRYVPRYDFEMCSQIYFRDVFLYILLRYVPRNIYFWGSQIYFWDLLLDILLGFVPRYTFGICCQICFWDLFLDILLRCVPSYTFRF